MIPFATFLGEIGLTPAIDKALGGASRFVNPADAQRANEIASPESRCIKIRWLFRSVAAILAIVEITLARNTFGPDPRSYMELSRAILRHDWAMVPNAYWSALYPWLLAAVLGVVKPSLRWEFPVAHAFSFPMLLASWQPSNFSGYLYCSTGRQAMRESVPRAHESRYLRCGF
jgi:hypothetical protein